MPKLYDSQGRFMQRICFDPGLIAQFIRDGYEVRADDGVGGERFTLEDYQVESWRNALEVRKED